MQYDRENEIDEDEMEIPLDDQDFEETDSEIGFSREYEDGTIEYYNFEGQLHRTDGPAIEFSDGCKKWLIEGKLHREDGPAAIYADGSEFYFLNGVFQNGKSGKLHTKFVQVRR